MKSKISPSSHEVILADGEFIVSKTDTAGRITYCNRTFMKIAGYSEKQLLSIQHNIVRHPDMPRGVFRFMWDTLQQGKEFFGYVKNMSADGSYYWVFANVTPDYDRHGKLQGFYSVRRKPKASAVAIIEGIYREMQAIERQASSKEGPARSIAYLQDRLKELNTGYEEFVLNL